jgi:hypothetical protein
MTDADRFGLLDAGDPVEVTRYERHFYHAYAGLTDNMLVRTLWDWDHTRALLRTRIPYRDQVIYAWRDRAGWPIGYLAVNLYPYRMFQGAAFGFAPAPVADPAAPLRSGGICEILNLMRARHPRRATVRDYRAFVAGFAYRDLVQRGFGTAYATCTRRRLRPYLLLGAELRGRTGVRGEERFLLSWPLAALVAARPDPGGPGPDRMVNRVSG